MKVKFVLLTVAVLTVGQSYSEPQSSLNHKKDPEGPIETSKCPKEEDPANPTVLPYPGDCSKFYKCLHGRAYPLPCQPGLHWSVELNRCDWPEVAKCDPKIEVRPTPTSVPSTTPKPSGTTKEPERHPFCPVDEDPIDPTVLPYPGDCTKFYKCLYGRAYPISCVPGLHWSTDLKRCDWPEVAKCDPNIKTPSTERPAQSTPSVPSTTSKPSGTTNGPERHPLCPVDEDPINPTVLPYPGDCSKFYKCLHGRAYPIACSPGLHWSTDLKRCDWPEVAKCNLNNKNAVTSSPVQLVSPETSTTPEPPVKHDKCPKDEDPKKPTFLPYPKDCTKFYKCKHGLAIPLKCPSGLHWSINSNRCDWPNRAGCDPNIEMIPTESPDQSTPHPSTTLAPPVRHADCPKTEDPTTPTYLPYPSDCSKFYRCLHGFAHLTACPSGLHWNKKLYRCDWPEAANCDPNIKPTTEHPINATTIASTTEAPMKHKGCPNVDDPAAPVYLPYPGDCSKFYKCMNRLAHAANCPSGLHWSAKESRCDWPEVANCDPGIGKDSKMVESVEQLKATPSKTASKKLGDACKDANRLRPHKNDCTKFFQCSQGLEQEVSCPVGTHFNAKLMICDHPENAGCRCDLSEQADCKKTHLSTLKGNKNVQPIIHKDCPDNYDPEHPAHLAYPNDCTKFYKCVAKFAYPIECPTGLHWSVKLERCDWPSVAKCNPESSVVPETTPTAKPSTKLPLTTPTPVTPTAKPTESTKSPTSKPETATNICKDYKDNVFLPHLKDCAKYVQCYNGVDHIKICPTGLHWNQNIKNCDYPGNVECSK